MLELSEHEYIDYLAGKTCHRNFCNNCSHRNVNKHFARKINIIGRSLSRTYRFAKYKVCEKNFLQLEKEVVCSSHCKFLYNQDKMKYISAETRRKLSEAGRRSAAKQFETKRSKDEMLFCKLCENKFNNVHHNQPIFNGWDADIILPDLKIAVLWNGPWHYKQISRRKAASLIAIQNRDLLKTKEILKAGWSLYIVKDCESHRTLQKRTDFVQQHFTRFVEFISTISGQFVEEFSME